MVTTQIQNLEVNELQELIENSVKKALEQKAEKQEPETVLITRKEVAAILGISLVTLNTWTKQGKVPALRIGTRVRYNKDEVLNSLKQIETLKYGRGV
jgi:excisionase family DNA binding protein